ncbi:conserved Plasmodium membrane protein, unknown function [Plasmodium relictum]|uniref:Uncharacterized protein n=1 Tax=Plasmodium relictum TaxID=85471 RepID=A0A1J1H7Q3_PLARL|nr:conserved Plasmodium membrane protein, unknown function [Plasmodium relictum]CRH00938.1 conserved Plasmodium membrane protein, unknown function [Plasmodium relictum]
MKTFAFLYKLNINEKNDQSENFLFSLHINKTYIYIGSTNGRIFILKKKRCLFDQIIYVNVIKISTNKIITAICIIDKFSLLINGTDDGNIFLIKNRRLIKGKEEGNKKNIIKLNNSFHKNAITSIKYLIKDDSLYIFIGDIDGVLSCFILKKNKNKIVNETALLLIDKVNGGISHIEISQKIILVTCEKFNAIVNIDEVILKKKINFKNIGKKENNNYKSVFWNTKKKKAMILSLRKNGRIWLSNEERVINTLVYYYSFFYFFYLFFFNSKNNSFSFNYYKNYFLNNKYFINLLEIILTKFPNFNIPLKPNLNACYKINNTFFILFEQTNPFFFLKNLCNINNNSNQIEKNEEKENMKKLNLSNDINSIKGFLKKKLLDEDNIENRKCLSFIINNLNDTEEILNKIKSKKILLINIKSIQIEEILDIDVKYSYSLYKTSNYIDNKKKYSILNEKDEILNKINDIHTYYKHENNISENCNSERNIEVNLYKINEDRINTSNKGNVNLNNNNEIYVNNTKVNTINNFDKIYRTSIKEYMYEHYFKKDRIIDSFLSKNKVYLLYYNNNLIEDFYFTLNMNDNIFTSFNFINRYNCNNKFNFYFCEIYLEENFQLLKYLRFQIEKLKKLKNSYFYIFYFFVNIFHCYLNDRKKLFDINFFFFIEKNLITINQNCYIENVEDILLRNVEIMKTNIRSLFSFSDKEINSLLIDKNYIYRNDFYDDKLFIIDFHYYHFDIKKIKKLYNMMKIIIIKYKYLFNKIINFIIFSRFHNNSEQVSDTNKSKEDTYIYKFISFIENNSYLLYNILYYFYIFLYLEIIITNYTYRNNICLTNFPLCFENKREIIKEKNQLACIYEKIHKNKVIYKKKKYCEENRENTKMKNNNNDDENNDDYENINKKLSYRNIINSHKNPQKNYIKRCNKKKRILLNNIFIKNNQLYELYLLGAYNYLRNASAYSLNLKVKKKKNLKKSIIFYKLFQHFRKKYLFLELNRNITTLEIYNFFLIFIFVLYTSKINREYSYYKFFEKLKFLKCVKEKEKPIKYTQINKNKKKEIFFSDNHLKKIMFLKKKYVYSINNEMEEEKEKRAYNYENRQHDYENMQKFSNMFYLTKYIKNIYNYYKKEKEKISIHEFLNCTRKLYFYKKVLEGVYIINLSNYIQIYDYFLLYETFFKIFNLDVILVILSKDYKINNTTNDLMKSLFFNHYQNMDKNNISHINIMTNKEMEYFEKLNKEVINNNVLLLDILLTTFNNIYVTSNNHLKFSAKKFFTFTYLNEYIDYIKQEEMREYKNNIILRKDSNFLYCCQNENYIKYGNYYMHYNLNNNNCFTNYDYISDINSIRNNLNIIKSEKNQRNKYLKSKKKYIKKNKFDCSKGNNQSKYILCKTEKKIYIQYIKTKLNEYILLNNKYNLKNKKDDFVTIFFKNIDIYNYLKIFYFLCKAKYNYYLYLKKKLERRRKVNKMNYDSNNNIQIIPMNKNSLRNKDKLVKMSTYSQMKNKLNILNYEYFYNLYKKRLIFFKEYAKYKYINNKFSLCSKRIRIQKKKFLKIINSEWSSELCIQFLIYLKKNIYYKFIRKKSLIILYQIFYVLILLKWKKALFLLLHIFRKKSHEIIFFLLLLIKLPFKQNYISFTLSEKSITLFYDKYIYILKNKLKFQNIIFPFLLQVNNNSYNFSFIMLLIIFFFFLEKSFFFKSILKSKKKMLDNYFLLNLFFFKKSIFLRKYIFPINFFKSFHSNASFFFSDQYFIKSILKSCYKLLNFEESNYLIVLNNSIYFHFIKLLYFFNINCFNFLHFHFFFFMLISSFYIGYFADFKYFLQFFNEAFSSISYKLQLINNQNEEQINHKNKIASHQFEKNSNYINNNHNYLYLKKYEQKNTGNYYYNIMNKKLDTHFLQTKKINSSMDKNNSNILIYNYILNKEKINLYVGYNLNFVEDKNKKIDFQDENILISINYLINFFYELLLKLLCEINLKLYNKKIELFILPNNRNTDLYIKINEFINTFYGNCILIYNKNNKDNIYNNTNIANKSNLNTYDKKNKIHIFLEIINLFFSIYHSLLSIKMCFKKKRIVFINKKKQYKKYLLIIIFVLFFNVTSQKGNKKNMLLFYKSNINTNNNFKIKRKIIKREKSLNILCCVLCIAHFINYFKYIRKNIKTKFLFIINYFIVNYNVFYLKQNNKKSMSSKNIHKIYKTIMKNLPKNIKSVK